MERVFNADEKLRRAEEMYYRRHGANISRDTRTVNVPVSNQKYLLKRMIIQIIICFVIYCSYYLIKNYSFIFSNDVIAKTNDILSYDIDIQDIYCKVSNYIKNPEFFKQEEQIEEQSTVDESIQENIENTDENTENSQLQDTKIETLSATELNNELVTQVDSSSLNQMQLDADEIKANYSLINPLQGQITSRFGVREQTSSVVSTYHVGLDIGASIGDTIVASMEGTVVASGIIGGYGKCVQIKKDDVLTIYGHCNALYVNEGDVVTQGQKIAEVGQTGNATGPHLHFEIRKSDRYVDPELIFS